MMMMMSHRCTVTVHLVTQCAIWHEQHIAESIRCRCRCPGHALRIKGKQNCSFLSLSADTFSGANPNYGVGHPSQIMVISLSHFSLSTQCQLHSCQWKKTHKCKCTLPGAKIRCWVFHVFLLMLASSIYNTRTSEALQLQEIKICCFIPAFQTNQAPLVVKPLTAGSLQQSCILVRELNEWKQQLAKGEISKQGLKCSLLSFEGFKFYKQVRWSDDLIVQKYTN